MRKLILLACSILLISCSHPTRFRLLNSSYTGIDFNNRVTETDSFHILSYEYIYNGAGVGVGDLNNDGRILPQISEVSPIINGIVA